MDETDIMLQVGDAAPGGVFSDPDFPAVEKSLGGKTASRVQVQWKRPKEISHNAVLFRNVSPSDARQGGLGDCWLISSIAAVAEFPGVIAHMFKETELSPNGQMTCRIYAPEEKKFVEITVDDQLPCKPRGGPAFAQAISGEMWVPILEKAYAKYVGSYDALSGGFPALALEAMTGAKSALYSFDKVGKTVTTLSFGGLTIKKASTMTGGAKIYSAGEAESYDEFWAKLVQFDADNNLMTLASPGKDVYSEAQGPSDDFGIVGGHAYTLMAAKEVEGIKMCQVRNPWGDFEWGGDWSDRSSKWNEFPAVKAALDPKLDKDDGEFWMTFEDMASIFTSVTVNFMNKETASQPGPPQVDEDGNPQWITQLADLEVLTAAVNSKLKEMTGMDMDVNELLKEGDMMTKCQKCCVLQ